MRFFFLILFLLACFLFYSYVFTYVFIRPFALFYTLFIFLSSDRPQVADLLETRPELSLGQIGNEVVADLIQAGTGAEVGESEVTDVISEVEKTGVLKVVGSLSSYMMRLGDEYTKSLQRINPHTQEYIRRLKDESVVVELAAKVQVYYERQGETGVASELALLQVGWDVTWCFGVEGLSGVV